MHTLPQQQDKIAQSASKKQTALSISTTKRTISLENRPTQSTWKTIHTINHESEMQIQPQNQKHTINLKTNPMHNLENNKAQSTLKTKTTLPISTTKCTINPKPRRQNHNQPRKENLNQSQKQTHIIIKLINKKNNQPPKQPNAQSTSKTKPTINLENKNHTMHLDHKTTQALWKTQHICFPWNLDYTSPAFKELPTDRWRPWGEAD